jgi:hypothetical protein
MGAQKGGTTALDRTLRQHPQIVLPFKKEMHYFDREITGVSGVRNLIFQGFMYANLVLERKSFRSVVFGEITPIYMFWAPAHVNIYKYNKNIKMIFLLRDPIRRAYSHWAMERARGKEWLGFGEAIRKEWESRESLLGFQRSDRVRSYVRRGLYHYQISSLLKRFCMENMLFETSEEFRCMPERAVQRIFDFLQIDPCNVPHQIAHTGRNVGEIEDKDKRYLRDIYYFDVMALKNDFAVDVSRWLE